MRSSMARVTATLMAMIVVTGCGKSEDTNAKGKDGTASTVKGDAGSATKTGPQDFRKDIEALSDSDPNNRQMAIANLASGRAKSVPHLIRALSSSDANVRWGAAGALALIGAPAQDALPSVRKMMSEDANVAVREMAQLAANRIGGDGVSSPPPTVRLTINARSGDMVMSARPEHVLLYLQGEKQDVRTLILSLEE